MRKVLPAIIMGVGAFLLVLGLLLKFYAYPQLAVVPLDQNTRQVVQDPNATFFDADNVEPGGGELTTVATVIGNPSASEQASDETGRDLAVWELGQKSDNNDDDMPMTASQETVVFDRHTGEAVNCCGESLNGQEIQHKGLVVKFPFDAQPSNDYQWWDGTTQQAYPVTYEATEELQGMEVYKYTMEVPLTKYMQQDLPGRLFGGDAKAPAVTADRYYSNKRTFWVDPVTGVVLDRTEEQHQEFQYDGQTLDALNTVSRFTQETVDNNVEEYKSKSMLLKGVQSTFSIPLMVIGALLLLGGLLMSLLLGRGRRLDSQPAYAPAADPVFAEQQQGYPAQQQGYPAQPDYTQAGPDDATQRRRDIHG